MDAMVESFQRLKVDSLLYSDIQDEEESIINILELTSHACDFTKCVAYLEKTFEKLFMYHSFIIWEMKMYMWKKENNEEQYTVVFFSIKETESSTDAAGLFNPAVRNIVYCNVFGEPYDNENDLFLDFKAKEYKEIDDDAFISTTMSINEDFTRLCIRYIYYGISSILIEKLKNCCSNNTKKRKVADQYFIFAFLCLVESDVMSSRQQSFILLFKKSPNIVILLEGCHKEHVIHKLYNMDELNEFFTSNVVPSKFNLTYEKTISDLLKEKFIKNSNFKRAYLEYDTKMKDRYQQREEADIARAGKPLTLREFKNVVYWVERIISYTAKKALNIYLANKEKYQGIFFHLLQLVELNVQYTTNHDYRFYLPYSATYHFHAHYDVQTKFVAKKFQPLSPTTIPSQLNVSSDENIIKCINFYFFTLLDKLFEDKSDLVNEEKMYKRDDVNVKLRKDEGYYYTVVTLYDIKSKIITKRESRQN